MGNGMAEVALKLLWPVSRENGQLGERALFETKMAMARKPSPIVSL